MAAASSQVYSAVAARTAVLASPDLSFRQRVRDTLTGLRWSVREATGGAEALAHLDSAPSDALIADFASGTPSASAVSDADTLGTVLNHVSGQRVLLDNSITQLKASAMYTQTESAQLQAAQTTLLQADYAEVSTQLSSAETQQTALSDVIAVLEKGSLFDYIGQ